MMSMKSNATKTLLRYYTDNPNECVVLTVSVRDGHLLYSVLSNAKVLVEEEELVDAVRVYLARAKELMG